MPGITEHGGRCETAEQHDGGHADRGGGMVQAAFRRHDEVEPRERRDRAPEVRRRGHLNPIEAAQAVPRLIDRHAVAPE